jgi:hypothetical protein
MGKYTDNDGSISKDTLNDTSKDTLNDTSKDTLNDTSKDTRKDTLKHTLKETLKDKLHDTSKDTLKDISKDTLNDTSKDTLKDTSKDALKDTWPQESAYPGGLSLGVKAMLAISADRGLTVRRRIRHSTGSRNLNVSVEVGMDISSCTSIGTLN